MLDQMKLLIFFPLRASKAKPSQRPCFCFVSSSARLNSGYLGNGRARLSFPGTRYPGGGGGGGGLPSRLAGAPVVPEPVVGVPEPVRLPRGRGAGRPGEAQGLPQPLRVLPEAPSSSPFSDAFDADLEAAIATYQRNFGLSTTGALDAATVSQMLAPRCGVADAINGSSTMGRRSSSSTSAVPRGSRRHLYAYFPGGPSWPPFRRELRYAVTATPAAVSIDRATLSGVFARAFARWAAATTLRFAEAGPGASDADITIGFYAGAHGDGEPFDGPLGTLAHAFSPTDGRLHLDAAEAWAVAGGGDDDDTSSGGPGSVDLESVAVHEIGHLLGLGHSSVQGAIMYPTIRTGTRKVELRRDDVEGIQSLYGTNPEFKGITPTSPSTSSRETDSSEGARARPGLGGGVVVVAVGLLLLLLELPLL